MPLIGVDAVSAIVETVRRRGIVQDYLIKQGSDTTPPHTDARSPVAYVLFDALRGDVQSVPLTGADCAEPSHIPHVWPSKTGAGRLQTVTDFAATISREPWLFGDPTAFETLADVAAATNVDRSKWISFQSLGVDAEAVARVAAGQLASPTGQTVRDESQTLMPLYLRPSAATEKRNAAQA